MLTLVILLLVASTLATLFSWVIEYKDHKELILTLLHRRDAWLTLTEMRRSAPQLKTGVAGVILQHLENCELVISRRASLQFPDGEYEREYRLTENARRDVGRKTVRKTRITTGVRNICISL